MSDYLDHLVEVERHQQQRVVTAVTTMRAHMIGVVATTNSGQMFRTNRAEEVRKAAEALVEAMRLLDARRFARVTRQAAELAEMSAE